jgi:hypothetical protein
MNKYLILTFSVIISLVVIYGVAIQKGLDSFIFAWILNFMLMISLLSFTQTLKPKLTSSYFNTKKWEKGGNIYQFLGVNFFRKLLVWIGWEKLNKKVNPVIKNLNALKHLEYGTRQSEFGHLIIFFIVLPINLYVIVSYGFVNSLWLLILNLILNFYPIIVQRYNRPRLKRAIRVFRN